MGVFDTITDTGTTANIFLLWGIIGLIICIFIIVLVALAVQNKENNKPFMYIAGITLVAYMILSTTWWFGLYGNATEVPKIPVIFIET